MVFRFPAAVRFKESERRRSSLGVSQSRTILIVVVVANSSKAAPRTISCTIQTQSAEKFPWSNAVPSYGKVFT